MYVTPRTEDSTNRFWQSIRTALLDLGIEAPEHLTNGGLGYDFWRSGDLVLSQTCGLPYRSELHRQVQLVGTFDYGCTDGPAGHYQSLILKRRDDTRTDFAKARIAYNLSLIHI